MDEIDSYEWGAPIDIDKLNHNNTSELKMKLRIGDEEIPKRLESSFSSSREWSSCDERSTPSPDMIESQERSQSTDEQDANTIANFHRTRSLSRRKTSAWSNGSSTDSASASLDDASSECERRSPSSTLDYDSIPADRNEYDVIIEKIVKLQFGHNNCNIEGQNSDDSSIDHEKENEIPDKGTMMLKKEVVGHDDKENGNYVISEESNEEDSDDSQSENEDDDNEGLSKDDDLVERGPVRPQANSHQSRHGKPYYTLDWVAGTSANVPQNQYYTSDYDLTAEQILRNKQFSDKLNPCLDKLSDYGRPERCSYDVGEQYACNNSNAINGWSSPEAHYEDTTTRYENVSGDDAIASLPSIMFDNPGEASLLDILRNGGFQTAQTLSDAASSVQHPSPGATSVEHWPDSPTSSYNIQSSCSPSHDSSRAHSPGSSANLGSPHSHLNMLGSPAESRPNMQVFRVGQALSSSESSNHSFADTPSPLSYGGQIDQRIEDQLGLDFGSFSTWCQSCMSSGTMVNSDETIDALDSNELQLVEEVIKLDQSDKLKSKNFGETQFVPKCNCLDRSDENDNGSKTHRNWTQRRTIESVFDETIKSEPYEESQPKEPTTFPKILNEPQIQPAYSPLNDPQIENGDAMINSPENHLVCPDLNDVYNLTYTNDVQSTDLYDGSPINVSQGFMNFQHSVETFLASNYAASMAVINDPAASPTAINAAPLQSEVIPQLNNFERISTPQSNGFDNSADKDSDLSKSTFNDFQIPEPVSSYRQNRTRKISERSIAIWPFLNLPNTAASERLKSRLAPREVEKAMKSLLKRSTEELAAADEDGDTMLMCLVGNTSELETKSAYLVPLVERLASVSGALTMTNKRNEDALYLAAMNCPTMSYVTGYLAAAMIQRGIDLNHRLYHTKGDTLIHAVASKGDSHGAVLAELLSLKTPQGNPIFDLNRRNYDGRTPLHVAVAAHDPLGSGNIAIGSTRLLLDNGADQRIKETKCGDTALHMAISQGCYPSLVKVLLNDKGHEVVNTPNYMNNTPVHVAAGLSTAVPLERQMNVCMQLISSGGLTNLQNRQGKTPLALVIPERKEVVRNIFSKTL